MQDAQGGADEGFAGLGWGEQVGGGRVAGFHGGRKGAGGGDVRHEGAWGEAGGPQSSHRGSGKEGRVVLMSRRQSVERRRCFRCRSASCETPPLQHPPPKHSHTPSTLIHVAMRGRLCASPRSAALAPRPPMRAPRAAPPDATPTPATPTVPYGVDLGTANSAVAIYGAEGPTIVPDPDTSSVNTPSWVAVDPVSDEGAMCVCVCVCV